MADVVIDVVTAVSFAYFALLVVLALRHDPAQPAGGDDCFFVFVVPCLNEELVIERTVASLLAVHGDRARVLVVDDDSDDDTVARAVALDPARVEILQRRLPEARLGKGASLNAAYTYLCASELAGEYGADHLIVAVVDADGEISADTIDVVAPRFGDPAIGAVQIGVAMYNRTTNLLTRLQDYEFAVYTEIMQRARQRIGSVGLGGNGQFVRLSALESLGDEPWTDCLAEDLDLGLRLLLAGWKNAYCRDAEVRQQAVVSLRAWIRQRQRWFQGHVQCWRHIPKILASPKLTGAASSDITWYLLLPIGILLAPIPLYVGVVGAIIGVATGAIHVAWLASFFSVRGVVLAYLLLFSPALVYGIVYQRRRRIGWVSAMLLAHALEIYCNLWILAGWAAVGRMLTGRRAWVKTARIADPVVDLARPLVQAAGGVSAAAHDEVVEGGARILGVEADRP